MGQTPLGARSGLSLLLIGLISSQGCSFVFVDGPPAAHRQMPAFDCTTSRLVPGLDTVWTVLQAARTLGALAASDADYEGSSISRPADIGLGAAFAAVGAAGMYYGFSKTSSCREAREELYLRMQTQPGMATWPPTAQPVAVPTVPAGPSPAPPAGAQPAPAPATPALPGAVPPAAEPSPPSAPAPTAQPAAAAPSA